MGGGSSESLLCTEGTGRLREDLAGKLHMPAGVGAWVGMVAYHAWIYLQAFKSTKQCGGSCDDACLLLQQHELLMKQPMESRAMNPSFSSSLL